MDQTEMMCFNGCGSKAQLIASDNVLLNNVPLCACCLVVGLKGVTLGKKTFYRQLRVQHIDSLPYVNLASEKQQSG